MWPKHQEELTKVKLAKILGVSRASLYYQPRQPEKDWHTKISIEETLHQHPSYGHKRIALALKLNKKRILRVMKIFGLKPYRRRVKKPRKKQDEGNLPAPYQNLLLRQENLPTIPNNIWVSDFTYLAFKGRFLYLATVMDLFSRSIVGFNILTSHNAALTKGALISSLLGNARPEILHSDQGREYVAKDYLALAEYFDMQISMSRKASPWENGYQESFYSQFKLELGDPNRFETLGELVFNICRNIHYYNNFRIHGELKMPPQEYLKRHLKVENNLSLNTQLVLDTVSKERGT